MSDKNRNCLGSVCESITYGVTASANFTRVIGPQLLRITDITENGVCWEKVPRCTVSKLDEANSLLRDGDIVVARTGGTVGKSFLVSKPPHAVNASYLLRLRPDLKVVVPEYLSQFLGSETYWSQLSEAARGAAQPNVNATTLSEIRLPLPSLDDQRQIATRLKAQLAEVEKARQSAQAQLKDSRLLRSRLLKEFFAELDAAPKKKLGDFAATTSGSTPSRGNKLYWQAAEIAWVKTGEVAFAPITATEEAISKAALAECSLSLLPPKTILIAMYGQGKTRGQSAILEIPATTNQACFAILPNDAWEPDFLYLWLKSSYQDLRDLSEDRGGNQANLNGALLKALDVPAPSKAEQQQIVLRIQAAMTEIDALENSSKAALEDINRLPSRVLAQAFDIQDDTHD
jgi:type I restriction enzyme S subunit